MHETQEDKGITREGIGPKEWETGESWETSRKICKTFFRSPTSLKERVLFVEW